MMLRPPFSPSQAGNSETVSAPQFKQPCPALSSDLENQAQSSCLFRAPQIDLLEGSAGNKEANGIVTALKFYELSPKAPSVGLAQVCYLISRIKS